MDNFKRLLTNRRSTRKFTNQLLSGDEVESILSAALLSPTSKNSRSCQFIVIDNPDTLEKLSKCKPHGSSFIADAVMIVIVVGDPLVSDVWVEDASVASISMQYQAEELGIGSCWVQIRERFFSEEIPAEDYIRGLLEIPMPLQIESIIAFGHIEKKRSPYDHEKLGWERVHIGRYGSH